MKIAEIRARIAGTEVCELNADKRYLMIVPRTVLPDHCVVLREWLGTYDLDVIVIPVDDVRLFEIEPEIGSKAAKA